jgi:predicted PurR-regulated permease PerM
MLTRILLALLICIAALYLAQMLWGLLSSYADVILLFVLGWLVSFVLNPLVAWFTRPLLPRALYPALEAAVGARRAQALQTFRFSRVAAVIIVYMLVAIALILAIALLVPPTIVQLSELASYLPEYMKEVPRASGWLQNEMANWGIRLNLSQAVQTLLSNLQAYAADAIRNALVILTGLVSFFTNLLLVLIISFIITLDGPKIRTAIQNDLLPPEYRDEFHFFVENVDRTFGGFLRGQIMQALLVGIGTALAMTLFAQNFILIASLLSGVFMLIPLLGPFLALIPPLLVCLIQSPHLAFWLFLILLIYQLIIVNVAMPRVLSQAVGLHPLLIFAALLIGIRVAGIWGAFFGIPIAGVLWAMVNYVFQRWQARHSTSP